MGAYILIILLSIAFIVVVAVDILKERKHFEEVKNLTDRIDWMEDQNNYLNNEIAEVNLKFSGSLDTREKNYNDIFMKLKKTEIELEKCEMERERLRAKLQVLEETENEEKEAEKED